MKPQTMKPPFPSGGFIVLSIEFQYGGEGGPVVSMAIQIVCGVNAQGCREVLAVEPMLEESKDTYQQLFDSLKAPSLMVSDVHQGWLR